jgi:hypothetical protein
MHPLVRRKFEARAFGVDPRFVRGDLESAVFFNRQRRPGSDPQPLSGEGMDSLQLLAYTPQANALQAGHFGILRHFLPVGDARKI